MDLVFNCDMMRKNRYKIFGASILILLVLASCEKVVENFDFLESDPKLVVNAPFTSDSIIIIHVSHTVGIMDDEGFTFVDDAVAELYNDDILMSTATYSDSGLYTFDVLPLAGETYVLKVSSPDYPATEAEIQMPSLPVVESVEYQGWDEYGTMLDITIDDPAETMDSYGLSLIGVYGWLEYDDFGNAVDTIISYYGPTYLISSDINIIGGMYDYSLSTDEWSDNKSGLTLIIEDDFVNGKEFTVGISAQEIYFAIVIDEPVSIMLESYSKDYIKFLKSMELYENSNDNPIAEKVSLFTNISGGLGVAFGKTITKFEYRLPPEALDGYKPYY